MESKTISNQANNKSESRVPVSQLAAYGAGGIIPIALFNIAGILVGLMGNISLGLSAFWLGVILIIPRLWDALSDPIIGHFSDNTRTRWGRRRPFLLYGGIAVALAFVVIWWIPKGDLVRAWFPSESGFQWFQLGYILVSLLIFFTAVNLFEIPHGALGMEMTTDYHERTRLFSAKSFVGNLFAMSTPWLFALASLEIFKGPGGNEADGMRYVSLMIAAILIPLSFWWFFKLREPAFKKVAKQEKTPFWKDMKRTANNRNFAMLTLTIFTLAMGFNFVSLLGSYIPIFYIFGGDKVAGATLLGINGTIWAITGVLAVFPLNWISPKLGKRKTLALAILLMCLAQLSKIVCYNPSYPYLIVIPTILLSAGMLFFFTLGSSMVGDICDEDELKTGNRSEGSYYSVFWWFIKMGTALASFVAGALIVFTLFDEAQVTKVDALQGSIRKFRNEIQQMEKPDGNNQTTNSVKLNISRAIDESKDFLLFLEKESAKKPENPDQKNSNHHAQRKEIITEMIPAVKLNLQELDSLKIKLGNPAFSESDSLSMSNIKENAGSILQIYREKASFSSSELGFHLENKLHGATKNQGHYKELIKVNDLINKQLANLETSRSADSLVQELGRIDSQTVKLTQQSPYTLLMMRVVEIGLPLLLSIFSVFFIFRYTLTEKRSHEIKDLLKQRNQELTKE
jgi:glycoside/pentoside/hexuronide:cation symporter, GPH family